MPTYEIASRWDRKIRVGRNGETIGTLLFGRWIADGKGEVEGTEYSMKLPAPWRGMRYRLLQGEREIASAARPQLRDRLTAFEFAMPGRRLELVAEDRHGVEWVLSEGSAEFGRYTRRPYADRDEWTAEFTSGEDQPALAAFVAWIIDEASGFYGVRGGG